MKNTLLIITLFSLLANHSALVCAEALAEANTQAKRPNFIVILADDLGYGDIGSYGSTLIKTPNIDKLAAQGIQLNSFYASANVCTASRGGLLTGRYPIRLNLVADVARPTNDIGLASEELTIAEALGKEGYSTALVGKWHLGEEAHRNPTLHGFDEFFGLLHSNDMAPVELYEGSKMIEYPVDQSQLTKRYTARAQQFIADNKDQPFFLYLSHAFPHVPLFVSPEFSGRSEAGLYGDVVEELDWSTGEIMKTLLELGLDDNTLVIFTSDNGPWWEGSAGQYRDRKGSSWEGGLRVPFIARWPAQIPAGIVSSEPAMNIDLLPTFVSAANVQLAKTIELDGKDILPMLKNTEASPHEVLYLFDKDRIAGVRKGQWKLVIESKYQILVTRFDHPSSYYGPVGLLFNLEKDPSETYSYARENPAVVKALRGYLEQGQIALAAKRLPGMWNLQKSP